MKRDLFASRIRLRHIHCFVSISQERNLGKAADKLRLTQPAVSKTLSELEAIVGAKLFERGRHGARMTRDGETFLTHAVSVLEALHAARDAVRTKRGPKVEAVHVGALPTVAPDLLPLALDTFRRARPHAKVVVQTAANAALLEMLKAGELDFVVGRMADPQMMVGLSFELLYAEPLILAVRAGHPLAGVRSVSLNDALRFPVIVAPKNTIPGHNTESYLRSRGFKLPANSTETLSVSLARLITKHSDAVWFTPIGAAREDIEGATLAQLTVSTEGTEEAVGLLQRSDASLASPALELMKTVRGLATARRSGARQLRGS